MVRYLHWLIAASGLRLVGVRYQSLPAIAKLCSGSDTED